MLGTAARVRAPRPGRDAAHNSISPLRPGRGHPMPEAQEGPGPDEGLSPAEWAWVQWMREVSATCPGVEFERDQWGQFWARRDGEPVAGPASTPAALLALIGCPRPREAAD